MKKILISVFIILNVNFSANCQSSSKWKNPSYRYESSPGFVNITELTGATGLGNTATENSKYYLGLTNVFGYQIDRNVTGGAGIGFLIYEKNALLPLFLAFRYNTYLRSVNPFIFADGGFLLDYKDPNHGSKIFVNPGIGLTRSFSSKIEGTIGAGLMVQMGDGVPRTSFINFKIGIILRKNSYRMVKPGRTKKNYCDL